MAESRDDIGKLEFQYKTVLDLGKFMYDSYFKLGAMSFTLNGLLLGSFSVLLSQSGRIPQQLYSLAVEAVGVIGLVYNFGAVCTFSSLVMLSGKLVKRFDLIDRLLKMEVSTCRSKWSDGMGASSVILTFGFFAVWIFFWGSLIYLKCQNELLVSGPPSVATFGS